jgi:peptide-methionine (R)-S-oxide reductase
MRSISRAFSLGLGAASIVAVWSRRPAWAGNNNPKSRTVGYEVQHSDEEWKVVLSPMQYYILREGGTERPNYSLLEAESRPGVYRCAGCGAPLFSSVEKFHSGTGWPSFARPLKHVEVEAVNPVTRRLLLGAEIRCARCGGHLGDVFNDGFLFAGTPAQRSGERYCVDGAALVFYPSSSSGGNGADDQGNEKGQPLRGDEPSAVWKGKKKPL